MKGDIQLRDVHFRHLARPEVQIFSGFSLRVPSGTTAALVGQSGSGKSTVISLLEGFYDPDSGEVLIDEVNLNKLRLHSPPRRIQRSRGNRGPIPDKRELASESMSRKNSLRHSISRGSSGSRRSFTLSFSLPGPINVQETADLPEQSNRRRAADNEENMERRRKVSMWRLARLNRPEMGVLVLGSAAAVVHGMVFPIFGLLLSSATHMFFESPHELRKDSKFWAVIYVGMGLITFVAIPIQNFFFGLAGGKLIERIRYTTFKKVVHQEISWFDDPVNSRSQFTDASTMRSLVGDALALIVQNIATITADLFIALTANWKLALIVLAISPLLFIQGYVQAKFLGGFSGDAKAKYEEASQVASDAVSSIRTVASFCAENKVMDLYQKKCENPEKLGIRLGLVSGTGYGFSFLVLFCANAFCFYIGAVLVKHGQAKFEDVFKVFFALTISAMGLSQSSAMAPDTNKAKDSAASIFEILDSEPSVDSAKDEGVTMETVTGNIELEHVSFRYRTRPDIQIFKDLSLSIPAGMTVALVGESGSGKSTVISLIERFYDPDSGRVLLDRTPLQRLKLRWLRQQMGLVSQEPILFNETIRANIAYGKEDGVSEEKIVAAAKLSNAHSFISSLPQGYDTAVGERGVQLSGGQKQRIAIARAILKDPRILLLDEATSALDAESERVAQDALDREMVDRTTVVVAHRLTTIRNAVVIAVVKNGENSVARHPPYDLSCGCLGIKEGDILSQYGLQIKTSNTCGLPLPVTIQQDTSEGHIRACWENITVQL
ncbi:hypothetical protein SAY86_000911 [Trapa natans]|uniref:ABC transporter B family member 9 n=1 Tax=Trapa natans TaxID=22666 RepID=A0AAN7M4S1_TRANT|nr:hypothetical protein SAY86_000911 [Trapa natans]